MSSTALPADHSPKPDAGPQEAPAGAQDIASHAWPLVVDLDGTLTPTDTLVESFFTLVRTQPASLLRVPGWLAAGRARLKQEVADRAGFDVARLPLREELLDYLRQEKARGRRIVLATAADQRVAQGIADRLGLFDQVLSSDGQNNLKGRHKLQAIRTAVGPDFVYAGDSSADLPVWQGARAAILVGVSAGVAAQVRQAGPVEREFAGNAGGLKVWLSAFRAHQWIKNVLIFLPLLTSFSFGQPSKVMASLLAFLAFSLMASATYMANDIWDLESDREHPRKRSRPFASGTLTIQRGVPVALGLLLVAALVAAGVSMAFLGILLVYLVATTSYSWGLKRYVLIDVVMLALLYTLRVLAGAIAIQVQVTPWLLAFCVFTFFSLALVKRCSELVSFQQAGKRSASGRDYHVTDLVVLWPLGVGAGLCAVVVFGLFVAAVTDSGRYSHANLLWGVGVGLIYWMSRIWIKTARGEMHDDPIVFTIRDFGTRTLLLAMTVTTLAAYFL
jgi:4-hydroxybenzoate polyprenyltransferase/phosphoserine phosphatase